MTEVVSVKFKSKGKIYFFDPMGNTVNKGDHVIVETMKGMEYAECVRENHPVDDTLIIPPLHPVIRVATPEDAYRAEMNKKKEEAAFEICREKILTHGLDMKLVDVEYSFDGSKILFCFTSDGRVDFRELVKDLAATFKMRIELRQIGVRDEARMLGGLGICGKPFCCAQFLNDFQPVSIKMAKTQGLSLNPTKISGTCGRLMCCLKYEQDAYEDLVKKVPKVDAFVDTPDGKGMVTDVNLLRSRVRVKLENQNDLTLRTYEAADVSVLGGKAQRAEYLAAVADGRIVETPKKPAPRIVERLAPTDEKLPEITYKNDPAKQEKKQDNRKNRKKKFEPVSEPTPETTETKQPKQEKKQRPPKQNKKPERKVPQKEAPIVTETAETAPETAENKPQKFDKKQKNYKNKKKRTDAPAPQKEAPIVEAAETKPQETTETKPAKENAGKHKFGRKPRPFDKKPKNAPQEQKSEPKQEAAKPENKEAPKTEGAPTKSDKPRRRPYYKKRYNKKPENKSNNE